MQRIPQLHRLSHDHHHALVLARRCKLCASPTAAESSDAVWSDVREAFVRRLDPHFRIEEIHLVPALAGIGESAMVERLLEEHTRLRELAALETPDVAVVVEFGHLLDSHVRFEEREVFELAQLRLSAGDLEAIAVACREKP